MQERIRANQDPVNLGREASKLSPYEFPIPNPALTRGRIFSGGVAVVADTWYQARSALDRMPTLERANVKTGWAGFYEDTPDKHPVIGRVPSVPGFICAAGFSGHGLMHAPAAGEAVAEMIVDGRTTLDLSALAFERFERGNLVREHNVI